jgi:hypothetical protein
MSQREKICLVTAAKTRLAKDGPSRSALTSWSAWAAFGSEEIQYAAVMPRDNGASSNHRRM